MYLVYECHNNNEVVIGPRNIGFQRPAMAIDGPALVTSFPATARLSCLVVAVV